jgi:hypothetical protein
MRWVYDATRHDTTHVVALATPKLPNLPHFLPGVRVVPAPDVGLRENLQTTIAHELSK